MYSKDSEKIVLKCLKCKQKLRIPLLEKKALEVVCPKCRSVFEFDCGRYKFRRNVYFWCGLILVTAFVASDIIVAGITVSRAKAAAIRVEEEANAQYDADTQKLEEKLAEEIAAIKSAYSNEVSGIDDNALQSAARQHYAVIWESRQKFEPRYAISQREKVQLEMLNIASDSSIAIEQIIKNIGKKASPNNSRVSTVRSSAGITLDIDFDMSELTRGEVGTRTKHSTLDSLRKETIRLISRVTNDVYQFCKDLDLASITIGCRHHVNVHNQIGFSKVENLVIYKTKLDKDNIKKLERNPFLDTYSTTECLEVIVDEFPTLEISPEHE